MTPRIWMIPAEPDCPVRDSRGTLWTPTVHPGEWKSEFGLHTTWTTLLTDRGPLREETQ